MRSSKHVPGMRGMTRYGQPKMSLASSCSIGHGTGALVCACSCAAKNFSFVNCQRSSWRHAVSRGPFTQCGAPRSTNSPAVVVTKTFWPNRPLVVGCAPMKRPRFSREATAWNCALLIAPRRWE